MLTFLFVISVFLHFVFFLFYFWEAFKSDEEYSNRERADMLIRWIQWPVYLVYKTIRDGDKQD